VRKFLHTPRSSKQRQVEHYAKERFGRTLAHVDAIDVLRNPDLHSELAGFPLNEHFDRRGAPRYRRLGLAFVAQQNPAIQSTFGSRTDDASDRAAGSKTSAKAYLASVAALDKDAEYTRKHREELEKTIKEKHRNLNDDVQQRQLELLFTEVPSFMQHLPAMAKRTKSLGDLLVPDVDSQEERRNRHRADQSNDHFDDKYWMEGKKMSWMFNQAEAINLSKCADLWTRATRGEQCPMGMDRTTYCRFILDVGLVDQNKVPYFWAVSLFDEVAQPMRCCSPNAIAPDSAPIARVVSRWNLLSVLDVLLRQHFTEKSKGYFLSSLLPIARFRLPSYIVEESDLHSRASRDEAEGEALEAENSQEARAKEQRASPLRKRTSTMPTMSRSQMEREGQIRDTLVRSMLLEPEVLHAISQHYKLFERMHVHYANEAGDMHFTMFLQFCTDFNLTPSIVPAHSLRRLYQTAACAESLLPSSGSPAESEEGSSPVGHANVGRSVVGQFQSQRPPSTDRVSTPPKFESPGNNEKLTIPWLQIWEEARKKASQENRVKHRSVPAKFGVNAFIETLCRGAFTYMESYGNTQQRCAGGYARITWLLTYLHCNVMHLHQSMNRRLQGNLAMEVHHSLRQLLESINAEIWNDCPFVDVPLLSPTIYKGGLVQAKTTMCTSGSSEQKTEQVHVVKRKRRKTRGTRKFSLLSEKTNDLQAESETPPLMRGDSVDERNEREGSSPSPNGIEEPAQKQSGSAAANEIAVSRIQSQIDAARGEEKKDVPIGSLCISNGVCLLCGYRSRGREWGNPKCLGCAIVDIMAFEHHPLQRLLCSKPSGIQMIFQVGMEPFHTERSDLTPPPLRSTESLRS